MCTPNLCVVCPNLCACLALFARCCNILALQACFLNCFQPGSFNRPCSLPCAAHATGSHFLVMVHGCQVNAPASLHSILMLQWANCTHCLLVLKVPCDQQCIKMWMFPLHQRLPCHVAPQLDCTIHCTQWVLPLHCCGVRSTSFSAHGSLHPCQGSSSQSWLANALHLQHCREKLCQVVFWQKFWQTDGHVKPILHVVDRWSRFWWIPQCNCCLGQIPSSLSLLSSDTVLRLNGKGVGKGVGASVWGCLCEFGWRGSVTGCPSLCGTSCLDSGRSIICLSSSPMFWPDCTSKWVLQSFPFCAIPLELLAKNENAQTLKCQELAPLAWQVGSPHSS